MDLLDRLIGHDRWTTDRLLGYCEAFTVEQWDHQFAIGHQTIRATFEHVLLARKSWVDLMTGSTSEWMRDEPLPPLPFHVLSRRNAESSERLERVARDAIEANRLDAKFVDAHGFAQSVGATIVQVILHAHAHRAEVLAMLAEMGVENLPDGDPQEWEWHLRNAKV